MRIPTRKWVIRGRAPVPRVMRWWRLGPWSRNRLMRSGDRAEAVMMVVAVLLLVLLQFAAAFGMVTYTGLERQAAIARATVHPVPAVLLEDPYPTPEVAASIRTAGSQHWARARWSAAGGERTGAIPVDAAARVGQTVTVPVDAAGDLTGTVSSGPENAVVAVTAGCGVWALGAGAAAVAGAGAHRVLLGQRMWHWAREWDEFGTPPGPP
ncbi:hypothetical protein QM806_27780 [Rhodococcus sp. IEGM 1351]|nr:hypothetical protein [Rhodococcus sp. IEGM 1351]